jgi:hypothetical protein
LASAVAYVHRYRIHEASAVHGFDPRDGVWEQRRDDTSIILGTRLIVHLAIGREGGQSIG